MKNTYFLIVVSACLASCSSLRYQVCEVKSSNVPWESKNYVYENDTVKVTYSFWADRGLVNYTIYNKLSIPLYLDWKKCSYLRNGKKNDYWQDVEIIDAVTTGKSRSGSGVVSGLNGVYSASESYTSGTRTKAERITFIAPKSQYNPQTFYIGRLNGIGLDPDIKYIKVPRNDNPAKFTQVYVDSFQQEESPIVFRVYLTYSTKENFESEHYIDNEFYVSKLMEMNSRQFRTRGGNTSYYYGQHRFYTELHPEQYR